MSGQFNIFLTQLSETNATLDYFTDFLKIKENTSKISIKLNQLNYLIGKIILASAHKNDWILDPFTGSSTTGIAANLLNRRFLGIDSQEEYLHISKNRKHEIEDIRTCESYRKKLCGFEDEKQLDLFLVREEESEYGRELNF